ncbi:MAG: endolytic transglycosylase MltG [Desulfuromonadales bacterium]|nr:endolytic transglycosylase MltG [Desulfuromonadales bacterium]MBN2790884.1 endolytic transglycosylase MltG [Desulfuromonadales bacterium]
MRRFFFWFSVSLISVLIISGLTGYRILFAPHTPVAPVSVEVQSGSSLLRVANDLEDSGVVGSALSIRFIARWSGQGTKVQAGKYFFEHSASPGEVFQRLVTGDVEKVSLTIPEGFTLEQIIERVDSEGYGRRARLDELAHSREFLTALDISAENLEGYLFPETYLFAPGIGEVELLTMMVRQFRRHMTEELLEDAKKSGLKNLHQLVTLASIIEKETAVRAEMPLISSVFHNRLKRRIPLQTDPTVIYGINDFDGNITRKHLETPTPYNTYLIRGLPPGPIASPGLDALQAAARPAASPYLYFVARGDGTHQFSRTLSEHNAAVRKYQLRHKRN